MRHKLEEEVARYNNFQKNVLGGNKAGAIAKEINPKTYAKYLLKEGSIIEQRELLSCMKSKLIIKNKIVLVENSSELI